MSLLSTNLALNLSIELSYLFLIKCTQGLWQSKSPCPEEALCGHIKSDRIRNEDIGVSRYGLRGRQDEESETEIFWICEKKMHRRISEKVCEADY